LQVSKDCLQLEPFLALGSSLRSSGQPKKSDGLGFLERRLEVLTQNRRELEVKDKSGSFYTKAYLRGSCGDSRESCPADGRK
jgi:hypothetical protein